MNKARAHHLLQDLGGQGPLLHLAHANGFPPGSYRQMARALADDYHLVALPARPLWPGSRPAEAPTWRPLAGDLVQGLDALGLAGIVGVGHSLGGVLTLWAALASRAGRPDLFRALVLVDPVILPRPWLWGLRLLRRLGLEEKQPLVRAALERRRTWPDRQACFDHYRAKELFARWSDAALWDYVNSGTVAGDDGAVHLRYPPEWEAHIFCTVPLDIWGDVARLRVPVLFLRGETSGTFRPGVLARLARLLPHAETATIGGAGHLVPMEKPGDTAAAIRAFLEKNDE